MPSTASALHRSTSRHSLGVCPSHAILLRQTICSHLGRSRPKTVPAASPSRRRAQTWCDLFVAPCALNIFQRIRLWFFRACGLASASISFPRNEGLLRLLDAIVMQLREAFPVRRLLIRDFSRLVVCP